MSKNNLILISKPNTTKYYINFLKTTGKIALEIDNNEIYMLSEDNNFLIMENGSYELNEIYNNEIYMLSEDNNFLIMENGSYELKEIL